MTSINDIGIVIAGGGNSSRFGAENKLFATLNGKPVFIYSILEFIKIIPAENIVITVPQGLVDEFKQVIAQEPGCETAHVVVGGASRTQSVRNGISHLPQQLSYVAIHDAARPLVSNELLLKCYKTAQTNLAAIPGKRVSDTLKRVCSNGVIEGTVDRDALVAVETPQVFNLSALKSAYDKADRDNIEATDDAGIMEYSGHSPQIVISEKLNIKITYSDDIKIAEAYLSLTQ